MNIVDYNQTAEDHQSFLVLVQHTGQKLSAKHYTKFWERIQQLECLAMPGQNRDIWVRYRRQYLKESNEWGDFQAHRKVLGLICLGRCSSEKEFEDLFEKYRKQKEEFSMTLFNSRLVVIGMNPDGSPLTEEQRKQIAKASSPPPVKDGEVPVKFEIGSVKDSIKDKRTGKMLSQETVEQVLITETEQIVAEQSNINSQKSSIKRTHSSSLTKDNTGSEVVFYPSVDSTEDFEEKIREFVTSLFFVLEGKRLDRSFERSDRMQLLCAPFEKKDFVGVDTDTRSFKKKCQGRLRKHLADLCLQAGLPGEAMLHYNTAIDILRPVNDSLWIGACYEGLCSASMILTFPRNHSTAMPGLRRNQSFSLKRGVAGQQDHKITRSGSVMRTYANGLQDLPETTSKSCLNPDDVIEKYREALQFYSKYKNAAMIEIEASFKACRVLISQQKYLQASDFLQNVVYINLPLSDEDKINRYSTLSGLYEQIGFHRKAAFYKRVAAMQCVAPQNPKQDWQQCYTLLLSVLDGYKIHMDPREMCPKSGRMNGWPVIQTRVLHELIYSAKRMGNLPLAVRHTTLLLHVLLNYLSPQDKREISTSLENLTSQCEGTTQPLVLDNGTIVPPVPLLNVPVVKSFRLMPLHPHLEPRSLCQSNSADSSSNNVFIFTPISLASSTDSADSITCAKMDFMWVQGDVSEVQFQVINHMPDELRISHIGLMTEGVDIETFPASPCVAAESGPYLVKVMCRPLSHGELTIIGYTTQVYGVNSNCRLRDIPKIPQSQFKVKVVPTLPQVQLSSSLPKAASFLSFGEDANVVTSGTTTIYMGQSIESQVTIQNSSSQSVDLIRVSMDASRESRELIGDVFQWNKDNLESQLPLQSSKLACFTVGIHGVGDFLVSKSRQLGDCQADERLVSLEGRCVEAVLKVEYSGTTGLEKGYCRLCSIAYSVDILPSLVFHRWDVLPAESPDSCYLLFDVENLSGHQLVLQYSTQSITLEEDQLRRIAIQVERCKFPADLVSLETSTSKESLGPNRYSKFIGTFVDIRWQIPSLSVSGKAVIDHLTWTREQLQLLQMSPLTWDVRVNSQLYSSLRVGAVELSLGDVVDVEVEMNVNADISEDEDRTGSLTITCCQSCDNGSISSSLSHQVSPLGCPTLTISKVKSHTSVLHACSFMFHCCGVYRFDIRAEVRGQTGKVKGEIVEVREPNSDTWRCTSVIEVKIGV